MGRSKHVTVAVTPDTTKKAKISRWVSNEESHERVSWRFGDAELDGPWSWTRLRAEHVDGLRSKLAEIEKLTWSEATNGGYPMKSCRLGSAPRDLLRRLDEIERDDIDCLFEIRLDGTTRVWGARRGNVFHVLWWDPDHEVWPSRLRNT